MQREYLLEDYSSITSRATAGSTCKGSTRQGSTRQGSTPQRNHPSFVGSTRKGRARKGSARTHHFVDLQQGVRARGVLARGILLPIICGAPVGSTRKGSTPFARTSPTPTPRGSSKIRGTLTSACVQGECSVGGVLPTHQILELP